MSDSRPTTEDALMSSVRPSPFAGVIERWAVLKPAQRRLAILVGIRLLLAMVFILNILPLDLRYGWYLHHGGDQQVMMNLAESILAGHPVASLVGIGQPLVMVPWIALLRPFGGLDFDYFDIVAPLVVINGLVLGGLSVWVIGGIVRHTTRDWPTALWSAGTWAALPLVTYFVFFWHHDPILLRSANVPKVGWLNGLSDAPATFLPMVAVLALAQLLESDQRPTTKRMVIIGMLLGGAILFRVHVAPMVVFLFGYVLVAYGWRQFAGAVVGGLVAYLPQAIYNQIVFRFPFTTGYISMNDVGLWGGTAQRPLIDILTGLPFHPRHVAELADYFIARRPWLVVPLILILAATIIVVVSLWRHQGWRAVALLVGTPLAYIVPMMTAWPFRYDVIRFSLPALPYLLACCIYAVRRIGRSLPLLSSQHSVGTPQA